MKNKRNSRKLTLDRSTVRALTNTQLQHAAGAGRYGSREYDESCATCDTGCFFNRR